MDSLSNCSEMQIFARKRGRIALEAGVKYLGNDLLIILSGGKKHIGALALASCNGKTGVQTLPQHRDSIPAEKMAAKLALSLRRNVAICAGIHYDAITRQEIDTVLELCEQLTDEICSHLLDCSPKEG